MGCILNKCPDMYNKILEVIHIIHFQYIINLAGEEGGGAQGFIKTQGMDRGVLILSNISEGKVCQLFGRANPKLNSPPSPSNDI